MFNVSLFSVRVRFFKQLYFFFQIVLKKLVILSNQIDSKRKIIYIFFNTAPKTALK